MKKNTKNKFGQYFTPEYIAGLMINMSDITDKSEILEPSCGEGVFVRLLTEKGYKNIDAYEIDKSLGSDLNCIKYESFVSAQIEKTYDLIIGNPPYIGWKNLEPELRKELSENYLWNKYFNSLCDYLHIFILKSITLLKEGGQLIFICPEYWMNTTHSASLRNFMIENGYFEEIIHFNEAPVFDNASIASVIIKYIKTKKKSDNKIYVTKCNGLRRLNQEIVTKVFNKEKFDEVEYLKISHFEINKRWLLLRDDKKVLFDKFTHACSDFISNNDAAEDDKIHINRLGHVCDIGNGMVTGLDKAFQISPSGLNERELKSTMRVIKAKSIIPFKNTDFTTYINIEERIDEETLKNDYPNFYLHLQPFKEKLKNRYQYNRVINYWEWVFKRNFSLFSRDEDRIFVPCKDRISCKDYFRFAMVDKTFYPTQDVTGIFKKETTKESLEYILAFLNTRIVFEWLKNYGIVKGSIVEFSQTPVSNIPFRKINWDDEEEVKFHSVITTLIKENIERPTSTLKEVIDNLFEEFLIRE